MSASLNKVHLIGNLGADPEIRFTPGGVPVANVNLATSYRTAAGDDLTEWHRVVLFKGTAETAAKYLKKGASVYIEGRLQTRKWTDKDEIERWSTEVVAESMQMLGGRRPDEAHQAEAAPASVEGKKASRKKATIQPSGPAVDDDDIPF